MIQSRLANTLAQASQLAQAIADASAASPSPGPGFVEGLEAWMSPRTLLTRLQGAAENWQSNLPFLAGALSPVALAVLIFGSGTHSRRR